MLMNLEQKNKTSLELFSDNSHILKLPLLLEEAILAITNRCCLNCQMCDIPQHPLEELKTYKWKQTIREMGLIGVKTIVLSGGEPLLRQDIFELIAEAKRHHMGACLTSNGWLMNKRIVEKLDKAGTDIVNISIEGPPFIHNLLRGKDSHLRALEALENLRIRKIESTIATMVSGYNFHALPYIVEIARRYGATTIRLQPYSRIFLDSSKKEQYFFLQERQISQCQEIIKRFYDLTQKYGIATNPLNYLKRIPLYLHHGETYPQHGCKSLWTSCAINAKGDIFLCWVMDGKDFCIGNLKKRHFLEIWNSSKHYYLRQKLVVDKCTGCLMSCYDKIFEA